MQDAEGDREFPAHRHHLEQRVDSVSPSELSSRFTCLTTAVGVMYSVAAALLKLPASATHKKSFQLRIVHHGLRPPCA